MSTQLLVLNAGSSSLKYQLFTSTNLEVLASGVIQNIGTDVLDHTQALHQMFDQLNLTDLSQLKAVAHRVVHGGELYTKATLIDEKVIKDIETLSALAPLHNPANLLGIQAMQTLAPTLPQVAVFDTAFHQTMPKENYLYAIPLDLYETYKIRKYGFHGTSHKYVSQEGAKQLEIPLEKFNAISLHLGNGASVCAIKEGKSFDTSMGFTPLQGLIMGTRSGDIDPAIVPFLAKNTPMNIEQIDTMLNKQSGLKALCGDNNMKNIEKREDKEASLALTMFTQSVVKYLGGYLAVLPKVDAIIFTGGIGENSQKIKNSVLQPLQSNILSKNSTLKVLTIPTNEEKQIALESLELF